MRNRTLVVSVLAGVALACVLPATAQQQRPQQPAQNNNAGGVSPLYWSVSTMIDVYVQQMTRYYNLTPQQQEYTRELLNQRVKRFLADYEKDVRWLAAEMFDYQMKGELPPPEIAKEWGERAKQLLPAIKQEIIDGNAKWDEILNDQQKQQHERDMKMMSSYFDRLQGTFDRWSKGDVRPNDFDANPDAGRVSRQPRSVRKSEDAWQYYVRQFIQIYNLDDSQKETAYSILRQLREEAARYREAHKEDFSKLEAAETEQAKSDPKTDMEALKKSIAAGRQRLEQRRQLEQPISEMFTRLKDQLEKIPTSEQKRERQAALDKLASWAKRGSSSRPAAIVSTAPADTRPEAATSTPAEAAAPAPTPAAAPAPPAAPAEAAAPAPAAAQPPASAAAAAQP